MLPGKKYTLEDMVAIAGRRKWLVIATFLVIYTGTFVTAFLLPDRYRSETLMMVVPQRVPEGYVKPTVTEKIEDRLRSMQNQILSRTNLERIINERKLYPAEVQRMPMEDVVEIMRGDVQVQIARGDAFRVAYTSPDPRMARDVANGLAQLFVNESEQDRNVLANTTTEFLEAQLNEARRRLVEAESKVADFQRRNAGSLPSDSTSNLQLLHNHELQMQALVDSTSRDRDRRLVLERALADLESEALDTRAAVPVSPTGDAVELPTGGTAAAQLEAARNALKALELRLKPEHPDVVYMKRLIRDLEAKAQADGSGGQPANPAGVPTSETGRATTPEQATAQRRLRELRQALAALDIQLVSKQAEEKRLRDQMASIQGRIAATPAVAADFTALTRDYDTIQRSYTSLLAKYEDAKAAAELENRQAGERFKVLDPARLPESPVSPNRPLIILLGALAGLAIGFGLVVLLEQMDKSLRSEDDVLSVLRLPVLAVIPAIETRRDRRRRKRGRVLAIASTATVTVIMAGATVLALAAEYLPLPQWLR